MFKLYNDGEKQLIIKKMEVTLSIILVSNSWLCRRLNEAIIAS